jgi:hypothetical protein
MLPKANLKSQARAQRRQETQIVRCLFGKDFDPDDSHARRKHGSMKEAKAEDLRKYIATVPEGNEW